MNDNKKDPAEIFAYMARQAVVSLAPLRASSHVLHHKRQLILEAVRGMESDPDFPESMRGDDLEKFVELFLTLLSITLDHAVLLTDLQLECAMSPETPDPTAQKMFEVSWASLACPTGVPVPDHGPGCLGGDGEGVN